jgi:hypothetical protein
MVGTKEITCHIFVRDFDKRLWFVGESGFESSYGHLVLIRILGLFSKGSKSFFDKLQATLRSINPVVNIGQVAESMQFTGKHVV